MATLDQHRADGTGIASRNGDGAVPETAAGRYCALCGHRASGSAVERFGEPFCGEAHAEEFVQAVRAARVQAAATALAPAEASPIEVSATPARREWKALVGKALCWGAPLLVLVALLGGGSQILGAASALLPALALLACPLGMLIMMRAMAKMSQQDGRGDRDREP